jgi:predicted nicotinamide N-methyase
MTDDTGTAPTPAMTPVATTQFIVAHTRLMAAGLVPEIELYLAEEPLHLWEMTEQAAGRAGLPPPFWAFAWAGGQALARYLLDHPEVVSGRRVIDIGAGSGLVAIAAAMAGAAASIATDIDPFAIAAVTLNAAANGVSVTALAADVLGGDAAADVILAADVCYEKDLAGRMLRFLQRAHSKGAAVLIGDLGRTYLPRSGLAELAGYDVRVLRALEDADVKRTAVWKPAW